jgi:hypothetical protein
MPKNAIKRLVQAGRIIIVVIVAVLVEDGEAGRPVDVSPQQYPGPPAAYYCCTQYGPCPLAYPLPLGAQCFCPSVYGPIPGRACN